MRVWLDLLGLGGLLLGPSLVDGLVAVRVLVREQDVRVGDRDQLQELVNAALAPPILTLKVDLDAGAVHLVPFALAVLEDRLVPRGVDPHLELVGDRASAGLAQDAHRVAGRQLAVHPGRGDPDALLAAALPEAVELRPVEQLAEDVRDLCRDDAWAVVLDDHLVGVLPLGVAPELDQDLRQDPRLLAGVEAVVDRLLDRCQQRLARTVEAEQVAVLGEELRDRDLALLARHAVSCRAAGPSRGLLLRGLHLFVKQLCLHGPSGLLGVL